MKSLSFVLLLALCGMTSIAQQREKLAIAGSYAPNIIIIDKQTKAVEWTLPLPFTPEQGGECNSITITDDGNVLFSYKKGARLVKRTGEIIWDFAKEVEAQEVQTAIVTKDGYMLGLCGNPSKFIFLDKTGKKVSETSFDTGINDIHAQFRQVRLASNGNILLPLMGLSKVVEIDRNGKEVWQFPTAAGPFSIEELVGKKLLISGGEGVTIYSRKRGLAERVLVKDTLPNIRIAYSTQSLETPEGTLLVTNWQGHANNTETQIVELDPLTGDILWSYRDTTAIKYVSAIHPFTE